MEFTDVIERQRTWVEEHQPFDYGTRLNLMAFMPQDGTAALLPMSEAREQYQFELDKHALGQLLDRVGIPNRLYEKLDPKINMLAINYLMQNAQKKDEVLLRCVDKREEGRAARVRALVSGQYREFDHMELLELAAPYAQDSTVRWERLDDLSLHLSLTWKNTATEIKPGDVVEQGIHISNSEVGVRSVTIASFVYRLICQNGAIGGGEDGGIWRFRHTGKNNRDLVGAAIEQAHMGAHKILAEMRAALQVEIAKPFEMIETISKQRGLTVDELKSTMDTYLNSRDHNLFGVSQAFSEAAQVHPPERSYLMQRISADVLSEAR